MRRRCSPDSRWCARSVYSQPEGREHDGGDQEKLVEAGDRNEEPSGPFGPRSVLRTDGNAEGGGEGLAKDCRGVDDVGGLKEPGTNHLNDVGLAQLNFKASTSVILCSNRSRLHWTATSIPTSWERGVGRAQTPIQRIRYPSGSSAWAIRMISVLDQST